MEIDRLETLLTDTALAASIDAVVRRVPGGYRATSSSGSIEFTRSNDGAFPTTDTRGDHPLADERTDQRTTVAEEQAGRSASLGAHATPLARASIAQYFDSPFAADLVMLHAPEHRFHGNIGEHGSLATTQARAPFIAAGAGVAARGSVDAHLRSVDVAPTMLALLGAPVIDGVDGLGRARSGVRLAVQDGDELDLLLADGEHAEHVVVFLWDGCNPQVLREVMAAGGAPRVAELVERGTELRHGALASLPTATLANHTAANTGLFPGRSGILHNTWLDHRSHQVVDLLDFKQMIRAREHIRPDVETIHEAVHRFDPSARTIATYEYADRGADWSTYARMASRQWTAPLAEDDATRHLAPEFAADETYRTYSRYDAHSLADALLAWTGDLGDLPRFSWVTFNLTDAIGHATGPHSPATMAAISDTDARMGEVIDAVAAAGVLDRTAFVMCADHGMQEVGDGAPLDVGALLAAEGIDAAIVDEQYIHLSS